jgi:hypothetical protein
MVSFYVVFEDSTTFETDLYDHILEVLNRLDYPEDQQIILQFKPSNILLKILDILRNNLRNLVK